MSTGSQSNISTQNGNYKQITGELRIVLVALILTGENTRELANPFNNHLLVTEFVSCTVTAHAIP